MEFQRTIIWIIFAFSLAMLWDRWEVAHGGRAFFLPALVPTAPGNAAPVGPVSDGSGAAAGGGPGSLPAVAALPNASAGSGALAAVPGAVSGAIPAELVHVETDLFRADFDAQGAVLVRAELLKEDVSADWTAEGLAGFITRTPSKPTEHIVLFDRSASREYLAESGLFVGVNGPELPNHRSTRFGVIPGPRILGDGQQELSLSFEARVRRGVAAQDLCLSPRSL